MVEMAVELPAGVFESAYRIRSYEVDRDQRLRPEVLFNYLQDAAMHASAEAGRGQDVIVPRGVNWFLLRIHLVVRRYPRRGETVRVRTWAWRMQGLYAIREFQVVDEAGATLADGTSQWILVDLAKRRPMRLPEWIVEAYTMPEERRIEDDFEKLPVVENYDLDQIFLVRLSDLDVNQHANSGSYFDWCLEVVPEEVHQTLVPLSIEIQYKKEANYRERLRCFSARAAEGSPAEGPVFHHAIRRVSDDELLAVGRSRWGRERPGG